MLPFGIQPIHLIIVVVVALIIFGPQKLPEIGRGLGKAINEFRTGAKGMTDSFNEAVRQPDAPVAQAQPMPYAPYAQSQPMPQPVAASPASPAVAPAPAPAVTCPNCHTANPADAAFCSKCGTKLAAPAAQPAAPATVACPSCSAANPADAAFCGKCGTKLESPWVQAGTAA